MDQNTVKERDDGLDGLESYLGSLFELTSQWEQREKLRGSYHLFFKKIGRVWRSRSRLRLKLRRGKEVGQSNSSEKKN